MDGDYQAAVIRLATLTENHTQYLLFASLELYPAEIELPPPKVKSQRRNAGNSTATVGIATLSIQDALAWYEGAIGGSLKIPGVPIEVPLTFARLSAEPGIGRLLLSNDIPFRRHWHGGLRVNRLVPMTALPEPLAHLSSGPENARQAKLRGWLTDLLGFDILAHDDFLGGVVLLAPNPVARGVASYIKETRADGGEVLGVKAALRRGHGSETLHIRHREDRPGGTAFIERALDRFGMAELSISQQCERTGLQLVCAERGVLSMETPAHFFRSVSVTSQIRDAAGQVDVPARRKGEKSQQQPVVSMRGDRTPEPSPQPVRNAAMQLSLLQSSRERRTGFWRPDGFRQPHDENEHVFFNNRPEAVQFIRRLVMRARRQVIFVDPYFDHIDVREFALAAHYNEVSVSVLTGRGDHLFRAIDDNYMHPDFGGDAFVADLAKLGEELRPLRRAVPDVRLMGKAARTYHDRFLVVDDAVWHVGHSFNQIGSNELSMVARMARPETITDLICIDVARAETLLGAWPGIKALRPPKAGIQPAADADGDFSSSGSGGDLE